MGPQGAPPLPVHRRLAAYLVIHNLFPYFSPRSCIREPIPLGDQLLGVGRVGHPYATHVLGMAFDHLFGQLSYLELPGDTTSQLL